MTAVAQPQAGGRTPSGWDTAPKKPVGRLQGEPSTIVNVCLPLTLLARLDRSLDRLEVQTGRKTTRGMIARRTLERFLETHKAVTSGEHRRGGDDCRPSVGGALSTREEKFPCTTPSYYP